jgi:hypothetical protein
VCLVEAGTAVRHNRTMLRRLAGLQACLALLLALVMGPFQHVHRSHNFHDGGVDHDDEVSTLVHAHPYGISLRDAHDGRVRIDDRHGSHTAWSLDTFTLLPTSPQFIFIPAESVILPFVAAESFSAMEVTETRGHDPPPLDRLSPRAPPV